MLSCIPHYKQYTSEKISKEIRDWQTTKADNIPNHFLSGGLIIKLTVVMFQVFMNFSFKALHNLLYKLHSECAVILSPTLINYRVWNSTQELESILAYQCCHLVVTRLGHSTPNLHYCMQKCPYRFVKMKNSKITLI